MVGFIVQRFWQAAVSLLLLGTVVFALTRLTGNPADLLLPGDSSVEQREFLAHQLGLDRPYAVQYFDFISSALQGDLGTSLVTQRPVAQMFFDRLPNTLALVAVALVITIAVGLPLGVLAGTQRGRLLDRIATLIAVIGISAPSFWVGLVLIEIFAVNLRLLPSGRMTGATSYILPATCLAIGVLAGMVRLLRSGMIEALQSDFVTLARVKGVSNAAIVWKHCLRNALIPVVTFVGLHIALMIGGAIVIETIFAWPGVGRLGYEGIQGRDYPVVQGVVLLSGALIVLINFLVDVSYAYIDPRLRIG